MKNKVNMFVLIDSVIDMNIAARRFYHANNLYEKTYLKEAKKIGGNTEAPEIKRMRNALRSHGSALLNEECVVDKLTRVLDMTPEQKARLNIVARAAYRWCDSAGWMQDIPESVIERAERFVFSN